MNVYFEVSFNPCFNGSMYKNGGSSRTGTDLIQSFNPCFNGSMYKNCAEEER